MSKDKKKAVKALPEEIKEKLYLTRDVDTSLIILKTKENDLVLDALIFLSKFADIRLINLIYLHEKGLLKLLLQLLHRDICLLRLSIRLINDLLDIPEVFMEFEVGMYDDVIEKINKLYISHHDAYVKDTCLIMLIKLTKNYRITGLVFTESLLQNFATGLKNAKNLNVLRMTMEFFLELVKAPIAQTLLPTIENFDVSTVFNYLNHKEAPITKLAYQIINKLTSFNVEKYQEIFKNRELVEKLMDILINPSQKDLHDVVLQILHNCIHSNITQSYFVESLQFVKFCLWVKTCDKNYLETCVEVFLKLSSIPNIRQMLFDLSVETSILSFLRTDNKLVLHKVFEAIINMIDHQYCCEAIVTPEILKTIFDKMELYDEGEDPIVLSIMARLAQKSPKSVEILKCIKATDVFIKLFLSGMNFLSEDIYISVMNVLYYTVINRDCREIVLTEPIFRQLIMLVENGTMKIAIEAAELLPYFTMREEDVRLFIALHGPSTVITALKTTKNLTLFKKLLGFIYTSLRDKDLTEEYLQLHLEDILKGYSEFMTNKVPLIPSVLQSVYQLSLPLKFFNTGRLEISEKLNDGFYLMNGNWQEPFPSMEKLLNQRLSSEFTVYYIDYSQSYSTGHHSYRKNSSNITSRSSSIGPSNETFVYSIPHEIKYGKRSLDPFLLEYIYHVDILLSDETEFLTKIKILSEYVYTLLFGPNETEPIPQKYHPLKLHIENLKSKLGTNVIPLGFLRIGRHCERALLFKAIADKVCIPCSLVRHGNVIYWNEVVSFCEEEISPTPAKLTVYVVDLMKHIGNLMPLGSREANQYCNLYTHSISDRK